MYTLTNFNCNAPSDFHVQADVFRAGPSLKVIYQISDLKSLLALPAAFATDGDYLSREDGLWNNTCFEMFLRPAGKSSYYEFNFSLNPAWNQYYFDSYRSPQPPKSSDDFTLNKIQWDGHKLEIELDSELNLLELEISLTAVLKEKSDKIHYFAVKHAGHEPDFHHSDSFILKR